MKNVVFLETPKRVTACEHFYQLVVGVLALWVVVAMRMIKTGVK